MLRLQECYKCLPQKTATFFQTVHEQYDADWVMKMDDDVYLLGERLMAAIEQWEAMQMDYVGCMKHGTVFKDPGSKYAYSKIVQLCTIPRRSATYTHIFYVALNLQAQPVSRQEQVRIVPG